MNADRAKVTAEVAWIHARGKLHLLLKIVGLALVFLALFNIFAPLFTELEAVAPYRQPVMPYITSPFHAALIPDLVVLTVGMILTWWG